MNYSISEKDGAVILTFKGKLMGGPESQLFRDEIKKMITKGKKNIVGDLGKVTFMNSSGLSTLIIALTSLRNAGGDLKICGASDRIESILMVTKLITVFDHHQTLESAVEAFNT